MTDKSPPRDLARTVLAVLFLALLLYASFQVLRPFLAPLIWATLLVTATWPLLARVQSWLGGRRWLAVGVMLLLLLAVFIVPLFLTLRTLVESAPAIAAWFQGLADQELPRPPAWVADLPLVGKRVFAEWTQIAARGPSELRALLAPHAESLAGWFVTQVGGAGLLVVDFLLTLVLAGILYTRGDTFADWFRAFSRRLAGPRGEAVAVLAASAVRAVAFGIVVTALIQAAAGGIGLVVAGVPAAALLTAIMLVSSVAQVGAAPVLALASVWLFVQGSIGWGIALAVWTLLVGSLDNVIRPLLIRKGVDLPLLLVFVGVIGGLISFGVVGLFAGPVVLAVSYTLLVAWVAESEPGQP